MVVRIAVMMEVGNGLHMMEAVLEGLEAVVMVRWLVLVVVVVKYCCFWWW